MKRHIPNIITSCNLLSGSLAVGAAFQQSFSLALGFIVLGAVFDFFDGFTARLLGVSSPIGKELDSLADVVTFGLAPATLVVQMLAITMPFAESSFATLIPYGGFLIVAFSAYRLAKYNLDTRQTHSFIGLPTPANALFWASLGVSLFDNDAVTVLSKEVIFWLIAAGTLLSCWILISEIPMFALKFKSFGWRENVVRYSFLIASLAILIFCFLTNVGVLGIAAIILLYVFVSLLSSQKSTHSAY